MAESAVFDAPLRFARHDAKLAAEPFSMSDVRLLPGPFRDLQEADRALLHRYPVDRLLHTFRLNAGLPTNAEPLGGWERPDCELRGHFVGHYLSACALMYASTGDAELRAKGALLVAELAKCQARLGNGYLSAFPISLFDRLRARQEVWAPFYTVHKILAGMLDMYEYGECAQALAVAQGMAAWTDAWTAAIPEERMQMVLDTEYGGMNDALYRLAAFTNNERYGAVGDRFTKKRFFDPLARYQDQLRGLHANTHIPQVIGAARRYELSSDRRFHDVADAFWTEVVETRTYATGGTSNNEGWLVAPNHLHQELGLGTATDECCCAYNMMKLTRQLFTWTADPSYFDYYERTLYNHRLGTIDVGNGHTQYYLGVVPGSWRTFATENDSFWCCNGTGVEEYGKLTDSIYFHDRDGMYVNLFLPSELHWKERGIRLRQTNGFPETASTRLEIESAAPEQFVLRVRVPRWVDGFPTVRINGKVSEVSAAPGSYLAIARTWNSGDSLEMTLPMKLRAEPFADQPDVQAVVYGPLVLAGTLGTEHLPPALVVGPMGPDLSKASLPAVPSFTVEGGDLSTSVRAAEGPLRFTTVKQTQDVGLIPFYQVEAGRPYALYWQVKRT